MLPALGIAFGATVLGAALADRVLLVGCAALFVESAATLVHSGASRNDMLPAYLAVALLAGLGLGGQKVGPTPLRLGADAPASPDDRRRPIPRLVASLVAGVLLIVQMVLLLTGFHPDRRCRRSRTGPPASNW